MQRNHSDRHERATDDTQLPDGQLLHLFRHALPVVRPREQQQALKHRNERKRGKQIVQHDASGLLAVLQIAHELAVLVQNQHPIRLGKGLAISFEATIERIEIRVLLVG